MRALKPESPAGLVERGRLLFNDGAYSQAHDVWEEVWRSEEGDRKVLLQGLIQVAAGCYKGTLGETNGCARLLAAGLGKLEQTRKNPPLEAFTAQVREAADRALAWKGGAAAGPGAMPVLEHFWGVQSS